LRWKTAQQVESLLQPFASSIRCVNVRITDVDGDLDSRRRLIQVVINPLGFVSTSAVGADPYESVERAVARVRGSLNRRLSKEAETSEVLRAA
jgi:hypothetical protein